MSTKPFFAVFEWTDKANGWYDLADAVGARVFKTERGAVTFRDKVGRTSLVTTERGYVVRSSDFIRDKGGIVISPAGKITMSIPCTCPLPNVQTDYECPYHFGTCWCGCGSQQHHQTAAGDND